MMMKRSLIFAVLLTSLALAGCTGKPAPLTAASHQASLASVDMTRGRAISASASGFQLLLFIPISINDRHERALQQLRAQAGRDYISDVKVEESWTYALVGTVYTTRLVATAYPYK